MQLLDNFFYRLTMDKSIPKCFSSSIGQWTRKKISICQITSRNILIFIPNDDSLMENVLFEFFFIKCWQFELYALRSFSTFNFNVGFNSTELKGNYRLTWHSKSIQTESYLPLIWSNWKWKHDGEITISFFFWVRMVFYWIIKMLRCIVLRSLCLKSQISTTAQPQYWYIVQLVVAQSFPRPKTHALQFITV